MYKVIVIDPVLLSITEIDNPEGDDLAQIKLWVRAQDLEWISGPRHTALVFDEWGSGSNKPKWKWLQYSSYTISGAAVLMGSDAEGNSIDVPYETEELVAQIQWQLLIHPEEEYDE